MFLVLSSWTWHSSATYFPQEMMVVAKISPQRCHCWKADTKPYKHYCLCVGIRILPPHTFNCLIEIVKWLSFGHTTYDVHLWFGNKHSKYLECLCLYSSKKIPKCSEQIVSYLKQQFYTQNRTFCEISYIKASNIK